LESETGISSKSFGKIEEFQASIALPEVVSFLVSVDYSCSLLEASHLAWLSEPYGEREFLMNTECPSYTYSNAKCKSTVFVNGSLKKAPLGEATG